MRRAARAALFYMQILISGGSGFIGRVLISELLKTDIKIFVHTHTDNKEHGLDNRVTVLTPCDEFPLVDVIVNLSGERIDKKRLTQKRLYLIEQSRTDTISLIASKYTKEEKKNILFIQASATGIYHNDADTDETGELNNSIYASICKHIEDKAKDNFPLCTQARFGVVTGIGGGLVRNLRFLPVIHFVNGNNLIPYITVKDCARALMLCINRKITGPVNFCSDRPLTLNALLRLCAGIKKITIPSFMFLLNFDSRCDLLKVNQKIKPSRLLQEGFIFEDPVIQNDL